MRSWRPRRSPDRQPHVHGHAPGLHGPLDLQPEEPHEVLQGVPAPRWSPDPVLRLQHSRLPRAGSGAARAPRAGTAPGPARGPAVRACPDQVRVPRRAMIAQTAIKSCCADLYASDWARLLLGDSLHPGGAALTKRLGHLMGLEPGMRVLDGAANVAAARLEAQAVGLDSRVAFAAGDAERLPCADGWFDAVICECAFCTFTDKPAAAAELARVLQPGGAVGIADLVRRGRLPAGLDDLLAWIACVADARPPEEYATHLTAAGLEVTTTEDHDQALIDLARTVRLRLMGARLVARLKGVELPGSNLARAHELARAAERAVVDGSLGYMLIVARKPPAQMTREHVPNAAINERS